MLTKTKLLTFVLYAIARGLILLALVGSIAAFLVLKNILLALGAFLFLIFLAGGILALVMVFDDSNKEAYDDIPGLEDWVQKIKARYNKK